MATATGPTPERVAVDPSERPGQARGYARALLSVAEAEGALDEVEDQLYQFARTVEHSAELRDALTDLALPVERKRAIVDDLLAGKASPHTLSIIGFILEQGRGRELGAIVEELVQLAAERRERAVAEVTVATDLSRQQRTKLAEALSRATGKQIELKVLKDPSIIGGVLARVGDQVIDGTVRRRLALARERLSEV